MERILPRFGWKDQHANLLAFTADAYLNEMGSTNGLQRTEVTVTCNPPVTTLVPNNVTNSKQFPNAPHGPASQPPIVNMKPRRGRLSNPRSVRRLGRRLCLRKSNKSPRDF